MAKILTWAVEPSLLHLNHRRLQSRNQRQDQTDPRRDQRQEPKTLHIEKFNYKLSIDVNVFVVKD